MILLQADARHIPLRDETVQCVVTSPPYWGLRDYGLATWEGGIAECDHAQEAPRFNGPKQIAAQVSGHASKAESHSRRECQKCGARRIDRGIGLERTPEEYVANIVQVFREVWRGLRPDGTVWLNLGDCYNAYNGNAGPGSGFSRGAACDTERPHLASGHGLRTKGLKPKDLVGIPWRVAFALQADGWYLRSDIVWAKPNPMPESVRDRPTKAHEYIFLLSKSQRYYYDAEAVKEEIKSDRTPSRKAKITGAGRNDLRTAGKPYDGEEAGRNLRSVWTIATQPFPGAHFATFPEALAERCIKAGTSERGACPKCGAGWKRVVEKGPVTAKGGKSNRYFDARRDDRELKDEDHSMKAHAQITLDWSPSCSCDAGDPVPCIVLDPFGGSGTVARVAVKLGRRAVHLDLGYHELARTTRCTQIQVTAL